MRIAVVGTCASGKSSVVAALRERGLDAYSVAQEHSGIPDLWLHLGPDRLVYLENSLATLRKRRNDDQWPGWIYDVQRRRLESARSSADVIVETDGLDIESVVELILARIGAAQPIR